MASSGYRMLVKYALELGLEDAGMAGSGHHMFRNPETGAETALSTTVQTLGRGIENSMADIRRTAGVDNRGREAVEGERRERRRKGRLGSGFNLHKAARELRNAAPRRPQGPTRDDLAAEREALVLELAGMKERNKRAEQIAARVIELDRLIDNQ